MAQKSRHFAPRATCILFSGYTRGITSAPDINVQLTVLWMHPSSLSRPPRRSCAHRAPLLYQMPVTSESMVVITVNVTGWASILSAKGFGFGRRDRERIYSSCFSRLFSSEECYYGDRAIFSAFGINLFESVMSVKHVSSKRNDRNRFIDLVFDIGWYRCVHKCVVH